MAVAIFGFVLTQLSMLVEEVLLIGLEGAVTVVLATSVSTLDGAVFETEEFGLIVEGLEGAFVGTID